MANIRGIGVARAGLLACAFAASAQAAERPLVVHVDDQLFHTPSPETVSMTIEPAALQFLAGTRLVA